jgi:nucleoside-diphosphate-sugar epimerase
MTEKVLVTGATGFIAGHCVAELLGHGYAVRGTVRDLRTADVAHLRALATRTGGSLELVPATLDSDEGWAAAVDGCAYVWHVASPNPASVPRDENDLIRPAVDGTLRVLRAAAAAGVRRVVLTSSIDAITHGHEHGDGRSFTEADWTEVDGAAPYPRSKFYAERAAWEFVAEQPLELVAVNPGLVLGPLPRAQRSTSVEVVRRILARSDPALPQLGFNVVDVRDLAVLHRLAMQNPAAAGNRYIATSEFLWMAEMAGILREHYGPRGYRITTRRLPYWLMWTIARFDPTIKLALNYVGIRALAPSHKARRELGWDPRPGADSVLACAESLLEHGIVARSRTDRPTPERTPTA